MTTEQNTVREGLLRAVIEASRGRMTDIEWEVATRDARSEGLTDTILASDWLAAHDAELLARARAGVEALPRLRRWIDDSELVDLLAVLALHVSVKGKMYEFG